MINKKTKIAVIGANYQYLSFYRQAKTLGYEIYAFARSQDENPCIKYADHFYDLTFSTDQDKILEICKKERVNGVTSFLLESPIPCVYYVSRGLGVPCNSPECEAITADKYTMREQMRKKNVSIPAYKAIHSINEIIDIPFPVIIKPADSGGSRGVTLVRKPEDLQKAIVSAIEWSSKKTVMVEQFIEGREFSVESISYKGEHFVLQITDKVTTGSPHFIELAHHQPAVLRKKQWNDIKELTLKTLKALKIEYGASHTEVKIDPIGNPYVIEMGPRMGGDFISSDLVRLSTGYDFVKGVLEIATGQFNEPQFGQQNCSGVYFLSKETEMGVMPYIQNKDKHSFIFDADIYGSIRNIQCNSDRSGYFIYKNDKRINV